MNDVTIVIPTYNEADNIEELVKRIHKSCNGVKILIVDDSPDWNTYHKACDLGCSAIHRIKEKGLSSAVIRGIKESTTSKVIVMDADLQHPPEVLPAMIKALEDNELVVGSRWVKGGGVKDWERKRVIISKVANALAWIIAPKIKDRTSGLFGVHKKSIDINTLNPIGWKIALEIMAKGNYKTVKEVPYIFATRTKGESKYNFKQVKEYLKHLKSLYLSNKLVRFLVVGGFGALLKLAFMFTFVDIVNLHYAIAYLFTFLIVVLNNYIWNTLWSFKDKLRVISWAKYSLISFATLLLNEFVLWILTGNFGVHYLISTCVGILIAVSINYKSSRKWVWKS